MKSKSPFRQDKCATAWAAWEKPYLKKPGGKKEACLLYTSPSPRDPKTSRMPSSA